MGSAAQPLVLVAYAWEDTGGHLEYVTRSNDPFSDRDALVWEAFENLERYQTGFEVVESGGGRMLVSAGPSFAAERVLCQSHMLIAHEKLGSDEILVSIPRRGAMLVCAMDCPDEVRHTMISLHTDSWSQVGGDPERITGELIVMEDGSKTGRMPISDLGR
jgi:hypothetical protein